MMSASCWKRRGESFMLRKWKLVAAVAVMTVSMIMPSAAVYAATVSEKTIEVPGGEKKHTVIAYGQSIAIAYPDGRTEIIANNPSGRIDVMVDGTVTKGIGTVVIPAHNGTNMVLEEGSFIVNGISDEQAQALKNKVAEGLAVDTPVASASAIESGEGMQGVKAFAIDAKDGLLASDGSAAPASALPEMQVKTPEVVYQAFTEAVEEGIRAQEEAAQREAEAVARREEETEADEEENSNGVTGRCVHEWEPYELDVIILDDGTKCATGPFFKCTKCGTTMWLAENMHTHGEDYCEYCGYNNRGERASGSSSSKCVDGGEHDFEDIVVPTSSRSPIIDGSYRFCHTGLIHECKKCGIINTTDAATNEHGDEFCPYCGFNQYGETAEGTPLG